MTYVHIALLSVVVTMIICSVEPREALLDAVRVVGFTIWLPLAFVTVPMSVMLVTLTTWLAIDVTTDLRMGTPTDAPPPSS